MGIIKNVWPFKKDAHSQFEDLIRPHLKTLYSLAYRLTGQRDDAEDLVQDLLLKVFPRLEEMQEIDKLSPWLSRILYRQFVDQYRKKKRSPLTSMEDETAVYETHASEQREPADEVNSLLTADILNVVLQEINEDQRILVLLHDVEGYSLQEISEMMDVPIGTLKSRHNRARTKLREIIHKMEPDLKLGRVYERTG